VPIDRVVHIPVQRIVEKDIFIDKVIEEPYEVEKIVKRRVEVPFEKKVKKEIRVDKYTDIEFDYYKEVEVKKDKLIEKKFEAPVYRPDKKYQEIEIPKI